MRESLRFCRGKLQRATISREAGRWFIAIVVEMKDKHVESPKGEPVGVDLGLKTFATLSTGEKIEAPKPLAIAIRRLRRLSKQHSRKKLGSNNRRKAARRLAVFHRKVKNIRKDFIHKFTTRLTRTHRQICIEDLNVSGMLKNHKLSRAIFDVSWSETRRQFEYKGRLRNCEIVVRDRFYASSKLCSVCGHKLDVLPLSVREWDCPSCGTHHDRDQNASQNLVNPNRVGSTRIHASGDRKVGVSPCNVRPRSFEGGTTPIESQDSRK
jgi:putative transposase